MDKEMDNPNLSFMPAQEIHIQLTKYGKRNSNELHTIGPFASKEQLWKCYTFPCIYMHH